MGTYSIDPEDDEAITGIVVALAQLEVILEEDDPAQVGAMMGLLRWLWSQDEAIVNVAAVSSGFDLSRILPNRSFGPAQEWPE